MTTQLPSHLLCTILTSHVCFLHIMIPPTRFMKVTMRYLSTQLLCAAQLCCLLLLVGLAKYGPQKMIQGYSCPTRNGQKNLRADFSIMVLSPACKPAARMRLFQFGYCSLQLRCLAGCMNVQAALGVLVRNWYLSYSMRSPTTHSFILQGSSSTYMKPGTPNAAEPVWSYESTVGFFMEQTDSAVLQTTHSFMLLITSIHAAFRQSALQAFYYCVSVAHPYMPHAIVNPQVPDWEILILQVSVSHKR